MVEVYRGVEGGVVLCGGVIVVGVGVVEVVGEGVVVVVGGYVGFVVGGGVVVGGVWVGI